MVLRLPKNGAEDSINHQRRKYSFLSGMQSVLVVSCLLSSDRHLVLDFSCNVIAIRCVRFGMRSVWCLCLCVLFINASFAAERGPKRVDSLLVPSHQQDVGFRLAEDPEIETQLRGFLHNKSALVVAVFDATCPLSKKFAPALQRLEQAYAAKNVALVHVVCDADPEYVVDKRAYKERGFQGTLLFDEDGHWQQLLRAQSTTEVFVIDKQHTVRYRGAINDQYGIGIIRNQAQRYFLRDALDAVLAKQAVTYPQTRAPGCLLETRQTAPTQAAVTYHQHISRIMQKHCVQCHRPGSSGPFSLQTYAQVKRKASTISFALEEGIMPPWFADAAHGGPWQNEQRLSAEEERLIASWIETGKTEGDPRHAPEPMHWPQEWLLEKPDLVVQTPRSVKIPAEGTIPYINVFVEIDQEKEQWVTAAELRSLAPQHMHHVLVFVRDLSDESALFERRRFGNAVKGYFAGAVPGKTLLEFPDGFAKRLPKKCQLKFQLHYTANGTPHQDQVSIAFRFADQPPRHEVKTSSAAQVRLRIPPHKKDVVQRGIFTADKDIALISFNPHAHVRSTAFRYELLLPSGERSILLDIPQYDFNWQLDYQLASPLPIPKGAQIVCSCWYDNSADNPNNPDPSKFVRFGDQTWDEMLIGYFDYYELDE